MILLEVCAIPLFVPEEYLDAMDDELVAVFVGSPNEAELMRSVLEGNGISAVIRGSGATGAYPVSVGALGETHVLVTAQDVDIARQLLRPDGSASPSRAASERSDRAPATHTFRRSVVRWFALAVLIVMIVSVVTTLDL